MRVAVGPVAHLDHLHYLCKQYQAVAMPGNPFKSAKDDEGGLLGGAGGLRSDQWDDHEPQQPSQPAESAAGSAPTAAPAAAAAAAPVPAPDAAQRSAVPAYTAADVPLPPPPPPVATASFIPPPLATQPPTVTGVPASTAGAWGAAQPAQQDRKSTRLNSSHITISYAVFCLKKKNIETG